MLTRLEVQYGFRGEHGFQQLVQELDRFDYSTSSHDHVLGRPDPRYRKYQIITVVALWSFYVYAKPHGPKPISKLSRFFGRRLTAWQIVVLTCVLEYVRRNFARVVGLESPEPLANMYNRDYFRATWVTTALDAGFWTAMRIRRKWVRDLASMVFTVYYLVCADEADTLVRKVRGRLSLEHLRVSWNKGTTPYLAFVTKAMRPSHLTIRYKPRRIRIPRPKISPYASEGPIDAWLYFDGEVKEMKNQDKLVLDIPGGGFVAMDPRCHDDKLMAWAAKTGFPVVSLNYKKAPEHPYPYSLNECYDAYWTIVASLGAVVGFPGDTMPKIVLTGDSAGGNLATALVLMILQARQGLAEDDYRSVRKLPSPEALILIYPALDVNITSWMTDEQSSLMRDPERRKANKGVVRRKTEEYSIITQTPYASKTNLADVDEEARPIALKRNKTSAKLTDSPIHDSPEYAAGADDSNPTSAHDSAISAISSTPRRSSSHTPKRLRTRLETTSMIAYFNDRVLSPEMLRAMIIMYIGPNNKPDLATDYLLSPLKAPESLLAEFPKVYIMAGEQDPLNDDGTLFAGRLRLAHLQKFGYRKELGLIGEDETFDQDKYVETEQISGISHGFLQFASVYPPGWKYIEHCGRWIRKAFDEAVEREEQGLTSDSIDYFNVHNTPNSHRENLTSSTSNEDKPLEMSSSLPPAEGVARRESIDGRSNSGRGGIARKHHFSGRRSPVVSRKSALQLQRLWTREDLMERRMNGVTVGLLGEEERPKTPG